jgi:DNA-binding IclR family transcriptional regulator
VMVGDVRGTMAEQHAGDGRRIPAADGERLVKSAYRVMQVFEFFSERRTPANATEIAKSLNFPQSSTSMLLKSLTTLGYLDYCHESRQFQPTIRVSLLGGWHPERLKVADRLLALLRQLQECTGGTVLLGAQHRHFVRTIFVLPDEGADACDVQTGSLWPICTNAMGHALLSLKEEADIRGIMRRANAEASDPARRMTPAALFERIERFRAQAFASSEQQWQGRETAMIAMLLPPEGDGTPLCVGVTTTPARLRASERGVARMMRDLVGRLDPTVATIGKRAGDRHQSGFPAGSSGHAFTLDRSGGVNALRLVRGPTRS